MYWEKAAFFHSCLGSCNNGTTLLPSTQASRSSLSSRQRGGTVRPASSVSVGKISISSTRASVYRSHLELLVWTEREGLPQSLCFSHMVHVVFLQLPAVVSQWWCLRPWALTLQLSQDPAYLCVGIALSSMVGTLAAKAVHQNRKHDIHRLPEHLHFLYIQVSRIFSYRWICRCAPSYWWRVLRSIRVWGKRNVLRWRIHVVVFGRSVEGKVGFVETGRQEEWTAVSHCTISLIVSTAKSCQTHVFKRTPGVMSSHIILTMKV